MASILQEPVQENGAAPKQPIWSKQYWKDAASTLAAPLNERADQRYIDYNHARMGNKPDRWFARRHNGSATGALLSSMAGQQPHHQTREAMLNEDIHHKLSFKGARKMWKSQLENSRARMRRTRLDLAPPADAKKRARSGNPVTDGLVGIEQNPGPKKPAIKKLKKLVHSAAKTAVKQKNFKAKKLSKPKIAGGFPPGMMATSMNPMIDEKPVGGGSVRIRKRIQLDDVWAADNVAPGTVQGSWVVDRDLFLGSALAPFFDDYECWFPHSVSFDIVPSGSSATTGTLWVLPDADAADLLINNTIVSADFFGNHAGAVEHSMWGPKFTVKIPAVKKTLYTDDVSVTNAPGVTDPRTVAAGVITIAVGQEWGAYSANVCSLWVNLDATFSRPTFTEDSHQLCTLKAANYSGHNLVAAETSQTFVNLISIVKTQGATTSYCEYNHKPWLFNPVQNNAICLPVGSYYVNICVAFGGAPGTITNALGITGTYTDDFSVPTSTTYVLPEFVNSNSNVAASGGYSTQIQGRIRITAPATDLNFLTFAPSWSWQNSVAINGLYVDICAMADCIIETFLAPFPYGNKDGNIAIHKPSARKQMQLREEQKVTCERPCCVASDGTYKLCCCHVGVEHKQGVVCTVCAHNMLFYHKNMDLLREDVKNDELDRMERYKRGDFKSLAVRHGHSHPYAMSVEPTTPSEYEVYNEDPHPDLHQVISDLQSRMMKTRAGTALPNEIVEDVSATEKLVAQLQAKLMKPKAESTSGPVTSAALSTISKMFGLSGP